MDRRNSLKSIFLGGIAGSLGLHGCKTEAEASAESLQMKYEFPYKYGRTPAEKEFIEELETDQFFNMHELDTVGVLCALILPANEKFGSALDAGVPDFIEFMAKDIPELQTTLRGGLMWLDHKTNTEFNIEFMSATTEQQKSILDEIAFYDPEMPMDKHPLEIQFFNLMCNLTLTGYYTTKMGIEDLGYEGNMPNIWDGVPEDVLAQHGMAYEEEWIVKCIDQSKRAVIAEWDDDGNLLT